MGSDKPDREAQERLADWRCAERAEADTNEGSVERRRAVATTRRARWAFEDAAVLASDDHGAPEPPLRVAARALRRLNEASEAQAALHRDRPRREAAPETDDQRDQRLSDEAEIRRELGE